MRTLSLVVAAAVLLLAGCSSLTAPGADELVGSWTTARESLHPAGSLEHRLDLGRDLRFVAEFRSYGVYPGQGPDQLSAYSRTSGSYRVGGNRLVLRPDTLVTFDSFYGRAEPTRTTPYPYTGLYDHATFEVSGDQLTLTYLSYPADAPVTTRQRLRRARP